MLEKILYANMYVPIIIQRNYNTHGLNKQCERAKIEKVWLVIFPEEKHPAQLTCSVIGPRGFHSFFLPSRAITSTFLAVYTTTSFCCHSRINITHRPLRNPRKIVLQKLIQLHTVFLQGTRHYTAVQHSFLFISKNILRMLNTLSSFWKASFIISICLQISVTFSIFCVMPDKLINFTHLLDLLSPICNSHLRLPLFLTNMCYGSVVVQCIQVWKARKPYFGVNLSVEMATHPFCFLFALWDNSVLLVCVRSSFGPSLYPRPQNPL